MTELSMDQEFDRMLTGDEPVEEEIVTPIEEVEVEAPIEEIPQEEVFKEQPIIEPPIQEQPAVSHPDWEQKYRSFKGIMESELRKLQDEISHLKTEKSAPKEETSSVGNKIIDEFWESYPDLKEPLTAVINNILDAKLGAFEAAKLAPIKETVKDAEVQSFFNQVAAVHPDWDKVLNSEAFSNWMEGLSFLQNKEVDRILKSGTVIEFNAVLKEFKDRAKVASKQPSQVISTVTPPKSDPRIDKLKAAIAVDSSISAEPSVESDENKSFEEMFAEEIQKGGLR